jgi:nitroreductase
MSDPVLDRRSIRKYTDQPVSDDHVETLLQAAMSAPSAGNQQPWHFVVIRDRAVLDAVPGFHPYARMMIKAPVAILVCGDESLEKSRGFWVEDVSAATENVLIEAQELGLGSVWLGLYPREDRVRKMRALVAGMPDHVIPFALLPVGYPAETKKPSHRYHAERVHHDRW